jgi:hypothetical protein
MESYRYPRRASPWFFVLVAGVGLVAASTRPINIPVGDRPEDHILWGLARALSYARTSPTGMFIERADALRLMAISLAKPLLPV